MGTPDDIPTDDLFGNVPDDLLPTPPRDSEQDARELCDIVPESPASESMMTILAQWRNFVNSDITELKLGDGSKIELVAGEKSAMLRLTRRTDSSYTIVQIPNIEVMSTRNIAPRRLFNYLLTAVQDVIGDDGKPTVKFLVFPLQNLIDVGMYASERSARAGFEAGMNVLEEMWIGGRVYHGAKLMVHDVARLFVRHRIEQKQCIAQLNTEANFNFVAQYRMVLSRFYYKLDEHAGDLFYHIMYCARQNVDLLKCGKPFNIDFTTIHERLGLPPLDSANTPTRDIVVAIYDAIEEIEEGFRKVFHYQGLQLLVKSKSGKDLDEYNARNFIGEGQLQVLVAGGLLKLLMKVRGKRPKKAPPTKIDADVGDVPANAN